MLKMFHYCISHCACCHDYTTQNNQIFTAIFSLRHAGNRFGTFLVGERNDQISLAQLCAGTKIGFCFEFH